MSDIELDLPQKFIPHFSQESVGHTRSPKKGQKNPWTIQSDANGEPCLYRVFEAQSAGAMSGLELIALGSDEIAELYLAVDDFVNLTGE